jgi:uncharacterized membrane protein
VPKAFVDRVQQLFARFCKDGVETKRASLSDRLPFRREASGAGSSKKLRHARSIAAVIVAYAIATPIARKRGYMLGRHTIVRCRQGHLFTTMWIPGASLKALRLGPVRFQRCPVGRHWAFVVPVKTASLSEDQRREAEANRDVRIP